jgi:hypothetical protein
MSKIKGMLRIPIWVDEATNRGLEITQARTKTRKKILIEQLVKKEYSKIE